MEAEFGNYAAQGMAGGATAGVCTINGVEKKETIQDSKSQSPAEYVNELAKLVPSVDFKVGNSYSTAKSSKTLTLNP